MANKNTGTKHDGDKPAFHLIDVGFEREVLARGPMVTPDPLAAVLQDWATRDRESTAIQRAFWQVAKLINATTPELTARLELARVLAFGAKKYSPNNWRGGFNWSRLQRAAVGHIEAHRRGDIYDEDTGYLHLSHALCNLMFLHVHIRDGLGTDDRAEIWPRVGEAAPWPEPPISVPDEYGNPIVLKNVNGGESTWECASGTMITVRRPQGSGWSWSKEKPSGTLRDIIGRQCCDMRDLAWPEKS